MIFWTLAIKISQQFSLILDFISRRRIAFPRLPDIGDVIVFPNTAGYFSHLFESPGHRGILPKEILFLENL